MPQLRQLELEQGVLRWQELGDGPTLVLLHGWSMSHAVFSEFAGLLAKDFRLLIPDLPGHGGSAFIYPWSIESIAASLAAWLVALEGDVQNLLGWSLGGQLALQMAVQSPETFEKLVLLSTTPCFCVRDDWSAGLPVGQVRALERGLKRQFHKTMSEFFNLQFQGEDLAVPRRQEIINFAVRPIGLPDTEVAISTLNLLGKEDQRHLLPRISHPSLVLHGEIDQIIPLAAGEYLADHLPDAEMKTFPDLGHAPFLSCPALVAQQLRNFCR